MKKIGIILISIFTSYGFAQKTTGWLLNGIDSKIDLNACYQPTPAVTVNTDKDQVLFQSTDGGTTWIDLSKGLPKGTQVNHVLAKDEGLYAGTADGKIYHTADLKKEKWDAQTIDGDTYNKFITGIYELHSGIYAGVFQSGLYKLTPGTNTWKPVGDDIKNTAVFSLVETDDGIILAGTDAGVYGSKDDGKTWNRVYADGWVNDMVTQSNVSIANTYNGLIRSTDNGENWTPVLKEVAASFKLTVIDGYFVVIRTNSSNNNGYAYMPSVSISNDAGISWQNMDTGKPSDSEVYDLEKVNDYLFSSRAAGISRSNDLGKTWQLLLAVPNNTKYPMQFEMVVFNGSMFAMMRPPGC